MTLEAHSIYKDFTHIKDLKKIYIATDERSNKTLLICDCSAQMMSEIESILANKHSIEFDSSITLSDLISDSKSHFMIDSLSKLGYNSVKILYSHNMI